MCASSTCGARTSASMATSATISARSARDIDALALGAERRTLQAREQEAARNQVFEPVRLATDASEVLRLADIATLRERQGELQSRKRRAQLV